MFGWAALRYERYVRASVPRTAAMLPRVPRWAVRRIARAKLARMLVYVWDHSAAQRERWERAGVRRRDLGRCETLSSIPFTTGADLVERPEEFLCAPPSELLHVFSTSGTKGHPKRVWLTADDLLGQLDAIAVNHRRLPGASRGLAIFDASNPAWSAGLVARRGFEAAGMFALLSGTDRPGAEHLDLIRDYRIDTLITTPTFAHRLTRETDRPLAALGVRWILLSGQPWTEDLRREIESAWGATVLDVYASTEFACGIASECPERTGLHLNDSDLWPEIVEVGTGRALAPGEEGELVLTTLARRGMPLVRYRTGDLARRLPAGERCACGSPLALISRVRGRVDDMVIVGAGNNVYPDDFDRALLALPGVVDYQVVLEKSDGWRDVLRVTLERAPDGPLARETVERALLDIHNVGASCREEHLLAIGAVEIVPPGTLSAGRPKTNRIVDRRATATA